MPPQQRSATVQRAKSGGGSKRGLVFVVVVLIVIVIAIAAFLGLSGKSNTTSSGLAINDPVPTDILNALTSVSPSTFRSVGFNPHIISPPQVIKPQGPALTQDGKPEIFYMGANFCPFCAAERWAIIVALSHFGHFSGLKLMESNPTDVYPDTNTFTFVDAHYSSPYVALTTREVQTRFHAPLQTLTKAEDKLVNSYDVPPYVPNYHYDGSFPFVDFGNKYVIDGASYNPQILANLNWQTIAGTLNDPSTPTAQAIDGTANVMTAAVCELTHNKPGSVCNSKTIQSIEPKV